MKRSGRIARRKGLTTKTRLKCRSEKPNAVERFELVRDISWWVRKAGICLKCGMEVGSENLEGHHVYKRSTSPALIACAFDVVPLCIGCHRWAHDGRNAGAHDAWIESVKPGIISALARMERGEWRKKPVSEAREVFEELSEWWKHWEGWDCRAL